MAEIDSLTIRIKAETGSAVAQLKQLTQLVEKLNSVANEKGWKSFTSGFARLGKASENVEKLASSLKKLQEVQVSPQFEKIGETLKTISSAAGSATRKMEKLSKASKDTGNEDAAKRIKSILKAVESVNKGLSAMGRELYASFQMTGIMADLDRMSGSLEKNIPILGELTSAWKSAASQIKNIVLSNASIVDKASQIILVRLSTIVRMLYSLAKLPFGSASMGITKGVIKLVSGPLKSLANTISDVKKRWDKFVSSIARVAVYRLIRTALKEIAKGLKEGVQNLYLWGQAWQNTYSSAARFVSTMDKLATAFLYLKNSIGAAVSPLLDVVAPVIDALIDKFVALANAINQALAALSGAAVWRRAIKYQYSYAEAANLTAKALKRTVLAFDELNKLDDPKGGGKNDNLDYSKMFEEVPVDDWLARILESSSWRILGTGIAAKINETLANLNWASIKSTARIWARRFGSLLDGVFMGISMPLLGKSLAEGLNTIALSINTFFKEFHFRELGKNLSSGFTSFINNLDWEGIGQALTQKWKALFELVIGAKDVDLTGLGSGIATMFSNAIENLPVSDLVDAIKTLVPKIATEFGKAINGIITQTNKTIGGIDAEGLGSTFATVIDNLLKEIDPKQAGIFLSNGLKKIIEFATGALKTLNWKDAKTWISDMITSLFKNIDLKQGVQNAVDIAAKIVELLTTVVNAIPWKEVGDAIAEADTTELKNGIKGLFQSVTDGLERSGFMDEIATGIATYFGLKLTGAIGKVLPTILTAKAFAGGGAAAGGAAGGGIAAAGGALGTGLGIAAAGALGAALGQQFSHHILGPLLEGFGSADAELYKTWTFFGEGGLFEASIDLAKFKMEDFEDGLERFGETHRNLLDAFKEGDWEGLITAIGDAWQTEHPIITNGINAIKKTAESASSSIKNVLNSLSSTWSSFADTWSSGLDDIANGLSLVTGSNFSAINAAASAASSLKNKGKITRRASGGMVDKGDLFLAGEAGPEIITSFGGDSAVMNMDQIISTISQSVAMANGGDITIPISLDGGILDKVIVTAQQRQNLRSGR